MLKKTMIIFAAVFFTAGLSGAALAQSKIQDVVDTKEELDVFLYKGDLVTLKVYGLTRIAVSDPAIVDIANVTEDEVLLIGRNDGETPIFIWDEFGKKKILARVFSEDLGIVYSRVKTLLDSAGVDGVEVEINPYEAKIMVVGIVKKHQQERLTQILDRFGGDVINLTNEEGYLIQIDAQVSELNTTLTKALGFDWTAGSSDSISLQFQETLPTATGKFKDLFKIGDFNRTTALLATVDALIQEGKGRILSKPTIVVSSGEQASFLVGGEIPIRTTTSSTGGTSVQENVTFKSYGIDLLVTPEIQNNKIDLTVSVSIRDIDAANAVGDDVAFTTRSADTRLLLENGQTIVIAGLIKQNVSSTNKRVPFLGKIPVLGILFRHSSTPSANQDQEVVISLTPRVIRQPEGQGIDAYNEDMASADVLDWELDEDLKELEMAELDPESMDVEGNLLSDEVWADEDAAGEAAPVEDPGLPSEAGDAAARYAKGVQTQILSGASYPYTAKEAGWTGTVKLRLTILRSGELQNAAVAETSGHSIFDEDALNTAQIMAPFGPFPAGVSQDELTITVPVPYNENRMF